MWQRMLDRIASFRAGEAALSQLVSDLRGLMVEANPHDPAVRDEFEEHWAPIDGELELRTEPGAPPGAASDVDLARYLDDLQAWVAQLLRRSSGALHE
jgi:hypothetical protein